MAEQDQTPVKTRDKKKETNNGELIRERRGMKRNNLPVRLPNDPTWLKQPTLNNNVVGRLD
jgi:hypothetical protein